MTSRLNSTLLQTSHVAFFGASVTQQQRGYVPGLAARLPQYRVSQLGFGGLHLRDALLLLDSTLLHLHREQRIDVCFLEWFTSSPDNKEADLIFLVTELLKAGILPVFLLLYNHNSPDLRLRAKEMYFAVGKAFGLAIIDCDALVREEKSYCPSLFRDETHLTDEGGVYFGNLIYKLAFEQQNNIPSHLFSFEPFTPLRLTATKPSTHKSIPEEAHRVEKGEIVSVSSSSPGQLVALWLLTGPESGVVRVWDERGQEEKLCVWDKWSHYDRFTIRRLSKVFHTKDRIRLCLIDDAPNYETCTRKVEAWPERCLWLLGWSIDSA